MKSKDVLPTRQLALLERFELSNRLLGQPHIVTYVVKLTSYATARLTEDVLQVHAIILQQHFPMLWTEVEGTETSKPYFRARKEGMWPSHKIVRVEDIHQSGGVDGEDVTRGILRGDMERMGEERKSSPETHPPFQITLRTSSIETQSQTYLSLSVEHTHIDGTGALRLLLLLLHSQLPPLPQEHLDQIPQYEKTVKTRPTLSHLLPIAYQELILPSLPLLLHGILGKPAELWPGKRIGKRLEDAHMGLSFGKIPPEHIKALKRLGKESGINTLHPIFHCIYLTALWAVVHNDTTSPFAIGTGTAISERDPMGKKHAFCTGVFISDLEYETSLTPDTPFWALVHDYASVLNSDSGRRRARGTIGLLKHIPNDIIKFTDSTTRTGWEKYFQDKVRSETPVRIALAVSNLGNIVNGSGLAGSRVECPSNTIEDIQWSQTPTPFVAPVMVNLIGNGGSLNWNTSFRNGSVVSMDQVECVNRLVERIARRMSELGLDGKTDIAVKDLVTHS